MNPLRRALLALGAAGVVMGALMAAVIATSDHTNLKGLLAALSLLVAWSFLGTGLYLWDRRPDNLTGPLMVALAFSWLLAGLSASNASGLYIAGSLLSGLPFAILTHLLFAFPSGRLQSRGTAASSGSATWSRRSPARSASSSSTRGLRRLRGVPRQPAADLGQPGRLRRRAARSRASSRRSCSGR